MASPYSSIAANRQAVQGFTTKSHTDTYPFIAPTRPGLNLSGRSVLITGASKGIGRSAALSYATAGCSRIAILARSSSALSTLASEMQTAAQAAHHPAPQVLTLTADVSSDESVRDAAAQVAREFEGKLDVLVNNAGYLEAWRPIGSAETDTSEWWRTWEINIKGMYLCTHYMMPLVLASETRTVLNVSSYGALGVTPGASAYQGSKFAVCRFSEFLMADHGGDKGGLVAIALHPGGVKTELAYGMPEFMHDLLKDTAELGGDTIMWLGSERREWLGGRFLSVSWDMEEFLQRKADVEKGDLLKFKMVV